jgi:hypothetical protein
MVRHLTLLSFVVAAFVFTGCKKSAEDVQKDWNTTEQNAQKYSAKYPAAKAVIDDLTKQAKADFEEAKKVTDKSKADKMKVAEEKLSKPLEVFSKYEASVSKLDGLLNDKTLMGSLSAADFKPLDTAAQAAKKKGCCIVQPTEKSCSDLQGTCAAGPAPANMGDLTVQLEAAIKDIDAAAAPLEAKKPKPAAPAGSAAAPAGSAAAAPAGSAAPAPAGSAAAAGSAK